MLRFMIFVFVFFLPDLRSSINYLIIPHRLGIGIFCGIIWIGGNVFYGDLQTGTAIALFQIQHI